MIRDFGTKTIIKISPIFFPAKAKSLRLEMVAIAFVQ
tara:strand:+ start:3680 stop:3790 length:111 start_codon:yes stop_codon:yes gene_type:complete